jgi:hypothetical protein
MIKFFAAYTVLIERQNLLHIEIAMQKWELAL